MSITSTSSTMVADLLNWADFDRFCFDLNDRCGPSRSDDDADLYSTFSLTSSSCSCLDFINVPSTWSLISHRWNLPLFLGDVEGMHEIFLLPRVCCIKDGKRG